MTTKEYLQQAFDIAKLIRADEEQIQRLKDMQTNISSSLKPDKVQTSRSTDPMGDASAALMDLMAVYAEDILRLTMLQVEIQSMIDSLVDSRQKIIMTERYINLKRWERIAVDNNYYIRAALKIHKRALAQIDKNMAANENGH